MQHGKEKKMFFFFGKLNDFFSYHKIGLLVLFVHDITDIWLELTKVLHYLGSRSNGREYPMWETAASCCFIIFTFCWYGDLILIRCDNLFSFW
jgi:hypothetical protein